MNDPLSTIHNQKVFKKAVRVRLCKIHFPFMADVQITSLKYSRTPIYLASLGKGFRPGISGAGGGAVNRIVKCTYLHINPVFGGRGKAPVYRGPVNRGFTVYCFGPKGQH